jgi:hypothetical protein
MFIRFWADTTGSQLSYYALEYMRSFMRVAPVRLISVTGTLAGRWQAYGALLATPMSPAPSDLLNAVCCDPSRWTWQERVPAGSRPVVPVGDHEELAVPEVTETITGQVELHTAGARRNVLFAVAPPRSAQQLATAKKYDVVVVPTSDHGDGWRKNGITPVTLEVAIGAGGGRLSGALPNWDKKIRELFIPGAA